MEKNNESGKILDNSKVVESKDTEKKEDLTEYIDGIKNTYVDFVKNNLKDEDPLKSKILEYFTERKDVNSEYEFILKKMETTDCSSYVENLKSTLKLNPGNFINKMERYFSVQSIYKQEDFLKQNPRIATNEEYELGAYREFIEPQVQDAVFELNKKGYKTFQSGYSESEPKKQFMDFYNKNVVIPEFLTEELNKKGVEIQVQNFNDRTTLFLSPINNNFLRQEEWGQVWKLVSDNLPTPDGELVEDVNPVGLHKEFRKVQDLLKKLNEMY